MSRQYSRVFISLKQDRAGYGFRGKEPSGRCVIEAKNGISKLTVYIQDIKPEIMYKAYIISGKHNLYEGVQVGTLNIDARGKAELKWEFDADNVCGTGKDIEEFNIFAVMIPTKNEIISPLVGYRDAAVTWKNNFAVFSQTKEQIVSMVDAESLRQEPSDEVIGATFLADTTQAMDRHEETAGEKPAAAAAEVEAVDTDGILDMDSVAKAKLEIEAEETGEGSNSVEEAVTGVEIEAEGIDGRDDAIRETENEAEIEAEAKEEIQAEEIQAEDIQAEEIIEIKEATPTDSFTSPSSEVSNADTSSIAATYKKFSAANDFFGNEDAGKDDFVELFSNEPTEAEPQSIPEVQSNPDPTPACESKSDIQATFLEMAKNFNRELKELEQITFVKPGDIERTGLSPSDGAQDPEAKTGDEPHAYPVSDGIEDMFINNPPMRPFHRQNIDVSWIRISTREIIFLPIDHWKYMNHSFIASAYNRFKHLILGKYVENGEHRYFLGVPEIYDSVYKKTAMSLGFTQFKCCEDVRAVNGEYGYWIMPIQS